MKKKLQFLPVPPLCSQTLCKSIVVDSVAVLSINMRHAHCLLVSNELTATCNFNFLCLFLLSRNGSVCLRVFIYFDFIYYVILFFFLSYADVHSR